MSEYATQFKKHQTESKRVAYEAWTAILKENVQLPGEDFCTTHETAFSAPTRTALERVWKKNSEVPFDASMVQHTYIVKFEDRSDKSL